MSFDHNDDHVLALRAAATVMASRFDDLACLTDDKLAAQAVTQVADVFVAWLRRPATLTLTLVSIEDQDTGATVPSTRGENMAVTLKTGQVATFDINSKDRRGFLSKAALDLTVSGDNITAEIVDTPEPTSPNQLVVTSVQPGAGGLVVLSVPDNETIEDASEAFDVTAGDVASVSLGEPVITEAP